MHELEKFQIVVEYEFGDVDYFFRDTEDSAVRLAQEECQWESTKRAAVYEPDGTLVTVERGFFK